MTRRGGRRRRRRRASGRRRRVTRAMMRRLSTMTGRLLLLTWDTRCLEGSTLTMRETRMVRVLTRTQTGSTSISQSPSRQMRCFPRSNSTRESLGTRLRRRTGRGRRRRRRRRRRRKVRRMTARRRSPGRIPLSRSRGRRRGGGVSRPRRMMARHLSSWRRRRRSCNRRRQLRRKSESRTMPRSYSSFSPSWKRMTSPARCQTRASEP
mmetsp:Transcript_38252/g.93089  ORF Transcript_38252/g.93089 Transcript_38252/m.93089 type:complete len:208 (+) Transcript_38252:244-867(+)